MFEFLFVIGIVLAFYGYSVMKIPMSGATRAATKYARKTGMAMLPTTASS